MQPSPDRAPASAASSCSSSAERSSSSGTARAGQFWAPLRQELPTPAQDALCHGFADADAIRGSSAVGSADFALT